ncbi:MAG TPA: DinB family protein, partial [Acidimicrobiales bacterium]
MAAPRGLALTLTIVPDDKDWTWVLERRCPECGFDASTFDAEAVAPLVRANAVRWTEILAGAPGELRRRPRTDRWAPLEYACHVRDVFRLFDTRLHLMLEEDDPLYPNWDQDATAVDDDYLGQDPGRVGEELRQAGAALAASFESVRGVRWERRGRRSDGASFTVATFGRYMIHDPVHHLHDVTGET